MFDSAAAIGLRLAGAGRWLNGKVNMSKGLELGRGSKRWWPLPQSFFSTILKNESGIDDKDVTRGSD